MNKLILFLILLSINLFAQSGNQNLTGTKTEYKYINGHLQQQTVTTPEYAGFTQDNIAPTVIYQNSVNNNSSIRWNYTEPVSIGSRNAVSGLGQFGSVGWDLNAERVSLYGNTNNTPLWEFPTSTSTNVNFVAMSDSGGIIASGSYLNIYMFNSGSSTPIFNFDATTLPLGTPEVRVLDITNDGKFIVAGTFSQGASDSNFVLGFSKDSTQSVWKFRVGQTNAGGSGIYGVKICANDSLAIVNTYGAFYVIKTYTGQILYTNLINPVSPSSGTQSIQAISGNGNFVATINYSGFVRVYQRSGNTYNFLWTHQEPPGTYYNWLVAAEFSADGQYLACGTLQFVSSSSFDGKVKLFRSTNSTPLWTFTGMGDQVSSVTFSKNGNILVACSYGDINNQNNDLYVWKLSNGNNVPIFGYNSSTSLFCSSISNNGSTIITSGKAVHARIMGSGGIAYNIFIDTNDTQVGVINNNNTPYEYNLSQNYPNPFNPKTIINYQLAMSNYVRLIIYDVMGREAAVLVNQKQNAGTYEIEWDASNYPSGVYFYKIESGKFTDTKKMILIK
ncbi:MAG: T9SS C-terminal target domain-containing protein [Ignavibacteriae bacterium]|nr:MAG: T9SS C-terminal target domain-containing protein [Ignavibacteriota bacterium]